MTWFNVNLTPGDMFRFALVGDFSEEYYSQCYGWYADDISDNCSVDIAYAYTRRTLVDAYAGGYAVGPDNGDMVFRAYFHEGEYVATIPEPLTMTLLGTGLLGIAGAARRRRRKENS